MQSNMELCIEAPNQEPVYVDWNMAAVYTLEAGTVLWRGNVAYSLNEKGATA